MIISQTTIKGFLSLHFFHCSFLHKVFLLLITKRNIKSQRKKGIIQGIQKIFVVDLACKEQWARSIRWKLKMQPFWSQSLTTLCWSNKRYCFNLLYFVYQRKIKSSRFKLHFPTLHMLWHYINKCTYACFCLCVSFFLLRYTIL